MPFIPTPETFLSLALCGSIRDTIVPPPILADYLLYHLNLQDPNLYTDLYSTPPTNDITAFLTAIARATGRLVPGGYVDEMAAATAVISRFRRGGLGMWPVDRVTPDAFDRRIKEEVLARQREGKGGGNVLESRISGKKGGGGGKGPMSGAIAKGRLDARKAVGKTGQGGRKVVAKGVGGGGGGGGVISERRVE